MMQAMSCFMVRGTELERVGAGPLIAVATYTLGGRLVSASVLDPDRGEQTEPMAVRAGV